MTGIGIADPTFNSMVRNIQKVDQQPLSTSTSLESKSIIRSTTETTCRVITIAAIATVTMPAATGIFRFPELRRARWQEQTTPGNMVRMSLTSTLTPSIVNRLAAGYNRFLNENGAHPATVNQGYAEKIGLQNLPGTIFPVIKFYGPGSPQGNHRADGRGIRDSSPNGS